MQEIKRQSQTKLHNLVTHNSTIERIHVKKYAPLLSIIFSITTFLSFFYNITTDTSSTTKWQTDKIQQNQNSKLAEVTETLLPHIQTSLISIDCDQNTTTITLLVTSQINSHGSQTPKPNPNILKNLYKKLPSALQRLSTGETSHINNPMMSTAGRGPVDGHQSDLSLTRGKLQGQTTLTVMSKLLLIHHNITNYPVKLSGDNKGVQ